MLALCGQLCKWTSNVQSELHAHTPRHQQSACLQCLYCQFSTCALHGGQGVTAQVPNAPGPVRVTLRSLLLGGFNNVTSGLSCCEIGLSS